MTTLLERAKLLRDEARDLEKQHEEKELPKLQEKYKDVVGTCYEMKNRSGDDKWIEYWYVKGIEYINVNDVGKETVSLICLWFSLDYPYNSQLQFIGNYQTYFHSLNNYGKSITREKFNKKFAEFQEKILI